MFFRTHPPPPPVHPVPSADTPAKALPGQLGVTGKLRAAGNPRRPTVSSLNIWIILQNEFRVEPGKHHQLPYMLGAWTAGWLGDPLQEREERPQYINK